MSWSVKQEEEERSGERREDGARLVGAWSGSCLVEGLGLAVGIHYLPYLRKRPGHFLLSFVEFIYFSHVS